VRVDVVLRIEERLLWELDGESICAGGASVDWPSDLVVL
jgi:hypothetical protein